MVALSIRIDLRMKTQLSKGYKFLFFYLIIIDSTYISNVESDCILCKGNIYT